MCGDFTALDGASISIIQNRVIILYHPIFLFIIELKLSKYLSYEEFNVNPRGVSQVAGPKQRLIN